MATYSRKLDYDYKYPIPNCEKPVEYVCFDVGGNYSVRIPKELEEQLSDILNSFNGNYEVLADESSIINTTHPLSKLLFTKIIDLLNENKKFNHIIQKQPEMRKVKIKVGRTGILNWGVEQNPGGVMQYAGNDIGIVVYDDDH